MESRIAAFFSRQWCVPPHHVAVSVEPLMGGLESPIMRASVTRCDGASMPQSVVIKELRGEHRREADVYELIWAHLLQPPAVRVLGIEDMQDARILYLEEAGRDSDWPWGDTALAAGVCRALATLHDTEEVPRERLVWDYESQLRASAADTLHIARTVVDRTGARVWRRLGDLDRVVRRLPVVRERLFEGGRSFVHGDVHPGNVILRHADDDRSVTLIDWGRARIGSPLEDVASWLHSLGCWEPQARRRHDTLLRAYLESRRAPVLITPALRERYWFASVSNGLAGAIRYHIAVLGDPGAADLTRYHSGVALAAWERVVRRASSLLCVNARRS